MLGNENLFIRSKAVRAVSRFGGAASRPDILDRIAELLRNKDWDIRMLGVRAVFWGLGSTAARPDILDCIIRDKDKGIQWQVVWALKDLVGAAARPDILDRIAEMLRDKNRDVRSAAASAYKNLSYKGVRIFKSHKGKFEVQRVEKLSQD